MTDDKELSANEIALYDRQIRLWGLEAQTKLRNSKILVINLSSINVEVVKNLMLGGVGSLTIIDSTEVLQQDLNVNFFIDAAMVGQSKVNEVCMARIQELNPRVELKYSAEEWSTKESSWFKDFEIVVVSGLNKEETRKLNIITRENGVRLYTSGSHGLYGYLFVDLIQHDSQIKSKREGIAKKVGAINSVSQIVQVDGIVENDERVEVVTIRNNYRSFDEICKDGSVSADKFKEFFKSEKKLKKLVSPALPVIFGLLDFDSQHGKDLENIHIEADSLKEKALEACAHFQISQEIVKPEVVDELARQAYTEFQPVSAVIGGAIAQDVINMLGRREHPMNNFVVFEALASKMPVYVL
ncbi:unnamed protein product [Kuraishia capsulata CBS 1993]|uniref:Ubiquitin-like 1-activating enzyme E1A n=1 Tax=Kuraishia capsulata CBS 1993 TaxID=1382522 RepID=W6MVU8_9ASCO|nr:uncharacterized protein KUCA_T00002532001 [Kuraishia capsulata CBS 1993]CDK26560.1 unnamed protein product [Kuraishia capsulata CBS 1993]